MAYANGATITAVNLLSALNTFAAANGFTVSASDTQTLALTGSSTSVLHNNNFSLFSGFSSVARPSTATATRLVLTKNGVSFQLMATLQTCNKNGVNAANYQIIEAWCCDSFNSGTAAWLQTNNKKHLSVGPLVSGTLFQYHFFCNGDFIHIVIEETPGQFYHLSFGFVNKYCTFTGGQYLACSRWTETSGAVGTQTNFNSTSHLAPFAALSASFTLAAETQGVVATAVRADIDSLSPNWVKLTSTNGAAVPDISGPGSYENKSSGRASTSSADMSTFTLLHDMFYHCSPLVFNGAAPLGPLYVCAFRNSSGKWSMLGEFPDVRFLSIANNSPGDEITLGTDVWKVFPAFSKQYAAGAAPISHDYGIAYKKVP